MPKPAVRVIRETYVIGGATADSSRATADSRSATEQ